VYEPREAWFRDLRAAENVPHRSQIYLDGFRQMPIWPTYFFCHRLVQIGPRPWESDDNAMRVYLWFGADATTRVMNELYQGALAFVECHNQGTNAYIQCAHCEGWGHSKSKGGDNRQKKSQRAAMQQVMGLQGSNRRTKNRDAIHQFSYLSAMHNRGSYTWTHHEGVSEACSISCPGLDPIREFQRLVPTSNAGAEFLGMISSKASAERSERSIANGRLEFSSGSSQHTKRPPLVKLHSIHAEPYLDPFTAAYDGCMRARNEFGYGGVDNPAPNQGPAPVRLDHRGAQWIVKVLLSYRSRLKCVYCSGYGHTFGMCNAYKSLCDRSGEWFTQAQRYTGSRSGLSWIFFATSFWYREKDEYSQSLVAWKRAKEKKEKAAKEANDKRNADQMHDSEEDGNQFKGKGNGAQGKLGGSNQPGQGSDYSQNQIQSAQPNVQQQQFQ